jgi:stearoyl-CoA desaturase (delta-9 desaturase)
MSSLKVLSLGCSVDQNGQTRAISWPPLLMFGILTPLGSFIAVLLICFTHVQLGVWLMTLGLFAWSLFSITLYYHRTVTHKGLKLAWPVELFFLIGGGLAIEGNAVDWVEKHRAHHAHPDKVGLDPHTPWEYPGWRGLLWAQWFWLFFEYKLPNDHRGYRDLKENRLIQWQSSLTGFPLLIIASLAVPAALYGWNGFFIAGVLRITLVVTFTGFINSVCHMWGSKTTDSLGREFVSDDSRNNWVVAILTGGEGLHNGHHSAPQSAHHGWRAELTPEAVKAGVKPDCKPRPDATYQLIQLLGWLHLAKNIKVAGGLHFFNDRNLAPSKELRTTHEVHKFRSSAGRRMAKKDRIRKQPSIPTFEDMSA